MFARQLLYVGRMSTYLGSCHCKAVRFVVDADIDHVRVCDCSICSMRGGLMFRVPDHALQISTPLEQLNAYRWGTRTAVDYFCRTCGILPFRRPSQPTPEELRSGVVPFDGWAVNTRCLEGFAFGSIPHVQIRGSLLTVAAD